MAEIREIKMLPKTLVKSLKSKKGVNPNRISKTYILNTGHGYFFYNKIPYIEKRFDMLIKIFKKGEFYKKYDLYIIGEGELKSELIKLTNKLELQHSVKFLGWQNNVYKWMNKAELVLQTSDREAFPMILIEALASGTKVVASDCEYGADEIMLGEYSQFISKRDDIENCVRTINNAINSFLVSSNYTILKKCCVENVCKEYLRVYNEKFK